MKKLLVILLVLITFSGKSQKFEYQVLFEGIGDNREYFNEIAYPQTILGTRGAFELGTTIDNHRIRFGLSYLFEFGADAEDQMPKVTMYYQFKNEYSEFLFGAFPRRDKIDFPLAMITDTLLYYRPNIEGLLGNISWKWGKQNAFIDWMSRQTDVDREIFMAGASGEIFYKNLFLENYILMTHVSNAAIRIPGEAIEDYLGFALQAGIRTNEKSILKGYLKAGIMGSSYRNRFESNSFQNAASFFAEIKAKYKKFGVKSVLSSGDSHRFAYGDLFYHAKNYWRTDATWFFINHENIRGSFSYSFHVIDWNDLDQQQQLSIIYVFGK